MRIRRGESQVNNQQQWAWLPHPDADCLTLMLFCMNRTIFRWITVKNLNTMQFDDTVRTDTPMGLLRGIKHGTESYHVLFKRICRWARKKEEELNSFQNVWKWWIELFCFSFLGCRFSFGSFCFTWEILKLCWLTLRGHQRLFKIRWLSAWSSFRGQPLPQFVERRLCGRSVAFRTV